VEVAELGEGAVGGFEELYGGGGGSGGGDLFGVGVEGTGNRGRGQRGRIGGVVGYWVRAIIFGFSAGGGGVELFGLAVVFAEEEGVEVLVASEEGGVVEAGVGGGQIGDCRLQI